MRFIVDEMPYYREDCPFHEYGEICKCACYVDSHCAYFEMGRDPQPL